MPDKVRLLVAIQAAERANFIHFAAALRRLYWRIVAQEAAR